MTRPGPKPTDAGWHTDLYSGTRHYYEMRQYWDGEMLCSICGTSREPSSRRPVRQCLTCAKMEATRAQG